MWGWNNIYSRRHPVVLLFTTSAQILNIYIYIYIIGISPLELFNPDSFINIFPEEQAGNILNYMGFNRGGDTNPATDGPDVFSISLQPPRSRTLKWWCLSHVNPVYPSLIICQLELKDDQEYPLRPLDKLGLGITEDILYLNLAVEELHKYHA